MLDVWYSEKCTRTVKLIVCLASCFIILICSEKIALPRLYIVLSLLLGMFIHGIRLLLQKFRHNRMTRFGITFLALVYFILLLLLVKSSSSIEWLLQSVQVMGFSIIGFMLLLITMNREKNNI